MGSCWSCLYRDAIQDNHPTKFKVHTVLTSTQCFITHQNKKINIKRPWRNFDFGILPFYWPVQTIFWCSLMCFQFLALLSWRSAGSVVKDTYQKVVKITAPLSSCAGAGINSGRRLLIYCIGKKFIGLESITALLTQLFSLILSQL